MDINKYPKKNHPKWHNNQIYSLFNLEYPERNSINIKEKKELLEKELKNID